MSEYPAVMIKRTTNYLHIFSPSGYNIISVGSGKRFFVMKFSIIYLYWDNVQPDAASSSIITPNIPMLDDAMPQSFNQAAYNYPLPRNING